MHTCEFVARADVESCLVGFVVDHQNGQLAKGRVALLLEPVSQLAQDRRVLLHDEETALAIACEVTRQAVAIWSEVAHCRPEPPVLRLVYECSDCPLLCLAPQ